MLEQMLELQGGDFHWEGNNFKRSILQLHAYCLDLTAMGGEGGHDGGQRAPAFTRWPVAITFLILLAGAHHFAGAGMGHKEIREIGQNLSDCIHGRRVV